MIIHPNNLATYSLLNSVHGDEIRKLLSFAINSADAGVAVKKHVFRDKNHLIINGDIYDLDQYDHVRILGTGKAVIPMASEICEILGNRIPNGGLIAAEGYPQLTGKQLPDTIKVFHARHPVPNQLNLDAGNALIALIKRIEPGDLVIFLLSGGGSALMVNPASGISLLDLQNITTLLLTSGAPIYEINTIRKHLDGFKGGGLAKLLYPATVVTLILSDVIGDNLDVIASGPTVSDPTTYRDAWNILEKYQILDKVPSSILSRISLGLRGEVPETIKPGDPSLINVNNTIVGNNPDTILNTCEEAKHLGYHTQILTTSLQGEASQVGMEMSELITKDLRLSSTQSQPVCWIAGGETTVTITGNGKGGRNQELVLGAVSNLSGSGNIILVSIATDGVDGPTDAAGAVASNETYSRGLGLGLHPLEYLNKNDSYSYFDVLGDLIKIGPTLTNVNDLLMIFAY